MKGKLISTSQAVLEIPKDVGSFQVAVKVDPAAQVHDHMINKAFNFEIIIPCAQFCRRGKECSTLHEKVCQEATCIPGEELDEIFVLKN